MPEANFDGIVGPTHNYAGLSPGNVASTSNRGLKSRPRDAALQAQRAFRRLLLSERLHFDAVEEALAALAEAEGRAAQVYRR